MKLTELEPVRVYLTALVGPIAAALVGFGIWDANRANLICGLLLAILSVPVTAVLRSKVTPVAKSDITGHIVTDVADGVLAQLRGDMATIPEYVQQTVDNALGTVVPNAVAQTTAAITQLVQQDAAKPVKVSNPPPVEVNPYA